MERGGYRLQRIMVVSTKQLPHRNRPRRLPRRLDIILVLFFWLGLGSGVSLFARAGNGFELEYRERIHLEKQSGSIDEVVALPQGGFAVRDYTSDPPAEQKIEFFGADGSRTGTIAAFGKGPTKYLALRDIAVDSKGHLWVADFGASRVLEYELNGDVLSTLLLQNPSFRPEVLAIDEERGRLFIAGCSPLKVYLDRGCLHVHEYRLKDRRFTRSFIETSEESITKLWASRVLSDLSLDRNGRVYFLEQAVFRLLRLDPLSGEVTELAINSTVAEVPPALAVETVTSKDRMEAARRAAYLLDRVVASGAHVAVSIRRPGDAGYLLAVFDEEGRQVATDLDIGGHLVGATRDGGWLFARNQDGRFVLDVAYPGQIGG